MRDGGTVDAADLFASADGKRVQFRRGALLRDLMLPDAARLDDRRRATLHALIHAIVATISSGIQSNIGRFSAQRGQGEAAHVPNARQLLPDVMRCLSGHDEVAGDLIDRVTLDAIGERLPAGLVEPGEWPGDLSEIAMSLRAAEARRRGETDRQPCAIDLGAESYDRFVWWTAAAIVRAVPDAPTLARAVGEASAHVLSAHDEEDTLESRANRMAATAGFDRDGLGRALDHCIDQRRIVLMVAILAHAVGVEYRMMRAMVAEPADTSLWLALRAMDLPREYVARLGFALCEADGRRDVEAFADRLDALMAVSPGDADAAIAPLRLPQPLRDAIDRLGAVR